jgi:putative ABC transport system permease protein
VFQFIMAILMITGTIAVYQQIQFMRSRSLGFQTDREIVVKGPRVRQDDFNERVITFKKELAAMPGIGSAAIVTEAPGRPVYWDAGGIRRAGEDLSADKNYKIVGIDEDFVRTLQLDPPLGRNFSPEFGTEASNLILNEEAARFMGFSSPEAALNQQVDYWGEMYTIVGVLKNYHQQSPKIPFEPHIYRYMSRGRGRLLQFVAHVQSGDVRQSVREIEAKYKQFFPGNPFEFYFLDDYFNQQYRGDEQFGKVIGLFAILALFITSLGILGLSAFMATQRIKEIGIRKVLGADMRQLISAMAGGFARLAGIAFLIAIPLIYLGIRQWLNGFAEQMPVTVWLFIPSLVIIGFVTTATMSAHVLKSILRNPVEALRYE